MTISHLILLKCLLQKSTLCNSPPREGRRCFAVSDSEITLAELKEMTIWNLSRVIKSTMYSSYLHLPKNKNNTNPIHPIPYR